MIKGRIKSRLPLMLMTFTIVTLTGATGVQAKPVKLVSPSPIVSGLKFPEGVTVAGNGDAYITDRRNNRVQEVNPSGEFVLMFGEDVNETKFIEREKEGKLAITEMEEDICTEEEVRKSGVKCETGVEGTGAGDFEAAQSITIDPSIGGNLYVQDFTNSRIDEYTPTGEFVLMFGKDVNETKFIEREKEGKLAITEMEEDICTEEEVRKSGVKCKAGVQNVPGGTERDAFKFYHFAGDDMSFGSGGKLYVGDEKRVQEFNAQGEWVEEIPAATISSACVSSEEGCYISALATDAAGNVYLVDRTEASVVREFSPGGNEVNRFIVSPSVLGSEVVIDGIATDDEGHLAVSAYEPGAGGGPFGSLYEASTGNLVTKFAIRTGVTSSGIAFDAKDELYVADDVGSEVLLYKPVNVAELKTSPVSCSPGVEDAINGDVALACRLNGEVNPWGVSDTKAWFEWGRTESLGEMTPPQSIEPPEEVSISISDQLTDVRPNEAALYYRLAAYDDNVQSPEEPLLSERVSFPTPITAPRIVGELSTPFVRSSSAVMFGELNPENASTKYKFQYGPCDGNSPEGCSQSPYVAETPISESAVYGKIGTTQEVTGLESDTVYHYRLVAENESVDKTEKLTSLGGPRPGKEGIFTTPLAPNVEAITGPASAITTTSAVVYGAVNPGGQSAAYAFEVGVYAGAATQYGIVVSGLTPAEATPVPESFEITGLQPGTTYAYRIVIKSGYGAALGTAVTFATTGLASVLVSPLAPAILATPTIAFPKPSIQVKSTPKAKCKRGYERNKRGTCIKVKQRSKNTQKRTREKKR